MEPERRPLEEHSNPLKKNFSGSEQFGAYGRPMAYGCNSALDSWSHNIGPTGRHIIHPLSCFHRGMQVLVKLILSLRSTMVCASRIEKIPTLVHLQSQRWTFPHLRASNLEDPQYFRCSWADNGKSGVMFLIEQPNSGLPRLAVQTNRTKKPLGTFRAFVGYASCCVRTGNTGV